MFFTYAKNIYLLWNQPKWKIYACFWAVRIFGRWAIKKSKPRTDYVDMDD